MRFGRKYLHFNGMWCAPLKSWSLSARGVRVADSVLVWEFSQSFARLSTFVDVIPIFFTSVSRTRKIKYCQYLSHTHTHTRSLRQWSGLICCVKCRPGPVFKVFVCLCLAGESRTDPGGAEHHRDRPASAHCPGGLPKPSHGELPSCLGHQGDHG